MEARARDHDEQDVEREGIEQHVPELLYQKCDVENEEGRFRNEVRDGRRRLEQGTGESNRLHI